MPPPSEAVTITERLQALGYRTGFVGKWHLEPNVTCVDWIKRELPEMAGKPRAQVRIPWDKIRPYSPAAQGFDEYFWGELRNYRVNYELDLRETDEVELVQDPATKEALAMSTTKMKQVENKDFRIDVQTAAAVSFIERNHAVPFYLLTLQHIQLPPKASLRLHLRNGTSICFGIAKRQQTRRD